MSDQQSPREPTDKGQPMPRWVKLTLIVVAVLVVTFIVLQIAGIGPRHGPGRHMQHSGYNTTQKFA